MIPVCDLQRQYRVIQAEVRAAIDRVLERSWFVLGEEVRRFEGEFASWLGVDHAVGVASGTDALHLALRALEVGPGDRVLTAPNSANPTACAIVEAGAIPTFADVDPDSGLLNAASIEAALDPSVKAIIPVHLYGRCVEMESIVEMAERHGIAVVEDAAQAHGASRNGQRAGTFGAMGCFSFYPSKNLGAYGDGGACVTHDPILAERIRGLRNYGEVERYRAHHLGFNSRLDELQGAVLRAKLPHLADWNERRRQITAAYRRFLAGLPLVLPPPADQGEEEAPHIFVIRVGRREPFRRALETRGIATQIHYPIPIHLQPAFAWVGFEAGSFPCAERRAEQIVTLPLFPEMTNVQVEEIAEAVATALRGEPAPEEIR